MEPLEPTENTDAEDQGGPISSLVIIGVLLFLIGAGILGFFFLASPGVIAFKNLSPTEAGSLYTYGAEAEMALASWGLFLAPIMIITGAIFIAAGCIVTAIHTR